MKTEVVKADTGATFEVFVEVDGTVAMILGARTGTAWTGPDNGFRVTGKSRRQPRGVFPHALGMGRRCVLTIDTGEGTTEVGGVALDPR